MPRDPIKDGRNWYSYCENNPVSRVDPDGLMMTSALIALSIDEGSISFAKGGNQNQRSDEFKDYTTEELQEEYNRPARTPEEKARKKKIEKELKARGQRNKKKRQENNYTGQPPLDTVPGFPRTSNGQEKRAAEAAAAGVIIYWIISEGTRLFPPRNLIPIP